MVFLAVHANRRYDQLVDGLARHVIVRHFMLLPSRHVDKGGVDSLAFEAVVLIRLRHWLRHQSASEEGSARDLLEAEFADLRPQENRVRAVVRKNHEIQDDACIERKPLAIGSAVCHCVVHQPFSVGNVRGDAIEAFLRVVDCLVEFNKVPKAFKRLEPSSL